MCQPNYDKIKNMNLPSCKNCVHYKRNSNDFYSRCKLFGEKNVITDVIDFDFAYSSRNNESKCGINGKYFQQLEPIQKFKRDVFIFREKNDLLMFYCLSTFFAFFLSYIITKL